MRVLNIHLLCGILFVANSLTLYKLNVCFNHPTIDWIKGTRTNKHYPSDHIYFTDHFPWEGGERKWTDKQLENEEFAKCRLRRRSGNENH